MRDVIKDMQKLAATFREAVQGHRHKVGLIITVVLAVGGFFVHRYATLEGHDVRIPWSYFPAVAAAIVLASFYFYWVLSHSTRLRLKLRGIENLEAILDKLSEYLDEGNREIFNARVTNQVEFQEWRSRQKEWMTKVENYLESYFGLREKNSFKHIVVLEQRVNGVSPEHKLHRNIIFQSYSTSIYTHISMLEMNFICPEGKNQINVFINRL